MKQLIYSKLLEDKLYNIHARQLRKIYPDPNHSIFEMIVQTNDINMDKKMYFESFIGENKYPYYWFNSNSEKPKYFCRVFILGESEEYLLNVFKDSLLVLI
jgi:hypothetical protein